MSDLPTKAVFLSYASQDAEAAKRIADALRAAEVEVWFDQSELVGGDAWDAKIRKRIKDCALLIPIISAGTQARREGYFRLEWRLAVERMRQMDDDLPFLLPVVIDGTKDAEAFVPDRFREVQWTRLPGGETPPAFAARVQKLLDGGTPENQDQKTKVRTASPITAIESRRRPWLLPVIFGSVVIAVATVWLLRQADPVPAVESPAAARQAGAPVSVARQLVAKAWEQMNSPSRAGPPALVLAGEWCERAMSIEPDNADAWAAASQVDTWMVYHNFDPTPARRARAQDRAARALQIAPHSFEARLAQACYVARAAAAPIADTLAVGAEQTLRQLLAEADEPRATFALAILLQRTGRYDEAAGFFDRMARHPAFAALAHGEKGWMFMLMPQPSFAAALEAGERSIALQPSWANLSLKQMLAQNWLGDLDAAVAAMERVPAAAFAEDFTAIMAWRLHAWRRDPAAMLRAIAALPGDWVRASPYEGPKALLTGVAHAMAGNRIAAEAAWRSGLKLVEDRLAAQSDRTALIIVKGELLARLGESAEAAKAFELARQITTNPLRVERHATIFGRDAQKALEHLERGMAMGGFEYTAAALRLNPELDWLRPEPAFAALQAKADSDPRLSPNAGKATAVSAAPASSKSVAVLAFANLSDDKANEYFSDGISEELLNVLAKVPGLKVSARTSAFYFKGKEMPIPEIAKQLGVAYVVEGSVRKQGDKVRITAQLIKAADGFHVWSDTFTRDLKDIFAVQDEIAGLIAKNLSLRLGAYRSALGQATVPEAFELYVKGRAAWNLRTREGYVQAESLLSRAIDLDPEFARAHSALADVWMLASYENEIGGGTYGWRNSASLSRITAKAEQALALDPHSAEAHTSLASALEFGWKWEEAERAYRRAIELNPNYATARHWFGMLLWVQGKMDDALQQLKLAAESDPLSHRILDTYARMLSLAGRPGEALAFADKALAIQPMAIQAVTQKAYALALLGRKNEAVALLEQIDTLNPGITQRTEILVIMQLAGADAALRRMVGSVAELPPSPFRFTSLIALGRVDEALAELRPADLHEFHLANIALLKFYDPVREDPRFLRAINEVGYLEHYQRARAWQTANSSKSKK